MDIICVDGGRGWQPITYMAQLAAELFSAQLTVLPITPDEPFFPYQLKRIGRRKEGNEPCLLILPDPSCLFTLYKLPDWRRRFGFVAAWVIDSFWIDRIPWYTRYLEHIDHYFVTNIEDVDLWQQVTKTPTSWLPWGSDALRFGSGAKDRPIDLLRVGREPSSWEDDLSNAMVLEQLGLIYQGRPAIHDGAHENQETLMQWYAKSKFLLAFSNAIDKKSYTHPTRQYLTARWVDALASGASIIGMSPQCETAKLLMWDGALIELNTPDRDRSLHEVAKACHAWRKDTSSLNYHQALTKLDWRWRFEDISKVMGINSHALELELQQIQKKIYGTQA